MREALKRLRAQKVAGLHIRRTRLSRCNSENATEGRVPIGADRDPTNEASLCAISMDCALFGEGSRFGAETQLR